MTGLLSQSAMHYGGSGELLSLKFNNPVIKGHYYGEGNWVWIESDTVVDWSRHASRQKPCVCEAAREVNVITSRLPNQSSLEDSIKPSLSDLNSVGKNSNLSYPQTPVRFLCLLKDPVCSTGARLPYFSSVLSRTSVICACMADLITGTLWRH